MLGLGEQEQELMDTMHDFEVWIVTSSPWANICSPHSSICQQEFVSPERFDRYGEQGRAMGFCHVASGPMVQFLPCRCFQRKRGRAKPLQGKIHQPGDEEKGQRVGHAARPQSS